MDGIYRNLGQPYSHLGHVFEKRQTDFVTGDSLGEGNSNEEMARQFRMTASEVNAQCIQIQRTLKLRSINALIRYAVCRVEGIAK